jgi:hypothetical protein
LALGNLILAWKFVFSDAIFCSCDEEETESLKVVQLCHLPMRGNLLHSGRSRSTCFAFWPSSSGNSHGRGNRALSTRSRAHFPVAQRSDDPAGAIHSPPIINRKLETCAKTTLRRTFEIYFDIHVNSKIFNWTQLIKMKLIKIIYYFS